MTEALQLRIKDLDLDRGEMMVRDGKGAKDRLTVLPTYWSCHLRTHLVGQIPAPVAWVSTAESYHNNAYFYFDVRMANSDSADGGLIGYFAVSKVTASVFDISLDSTPVSGADLSAATRSLRKRHCITQQRLLKYEDDEPIG